LAFPCSSLQVLGGNFCVLPKRSQDPQDSQDFPRLSVEGPRFDPSRPSKTRSFVASQRPRGPEAQSRAERRSEETGRGHVEVPRSVSTDSPGLQRTDTLRLIMIMTMTALNYYWRDGGIFCLASHVLFLASLCDDFLLLRVYRLHSWLLLAAWAVDLYLLSTTTTKLTSTDTFMRR
jgi:hypothetical protein